MIDAEPSEASMGIHFYKGRRKTIHLLTALAGQGISSALSLSKNLTHGPPRCQTDTVHVWEATSQPQLNIMEEEPDFDEEF